jgi:L-aminoadipate-semialdehyde dehydrogenase
LLERLLLRFSRAKVLCLVRAENEQKGLERIMTNMKNHHCWQDAFAQRIQIVPGDLGLPRFGLDEARFWALAEVDAIYHNGALVHWVFPYQKLKGASRVSSWPTLIYLFTLLISAEGAQGRLLLSPSPSLHPFFFSSCMQPPTWRAPRSCCGCAPMAA